MKTILAVDGNSIINRAYFGVRPLTNRKGQRTEAIYGMLNIILSQAERVKPTCVQVAFDLHAPTFRHKMYDDYKAGRRGMDEELRAQMEPAKEVLRALGYEVLSLEGYEADDILGTISKRAGEEDAFCYILTGDRDSLQLINEHTGVLLVSKGETTLYDSARFEEKYGIKPDQFVDAKALMGDQSDNIPGVPGVGEKTALPLIAKFGSLDGVYEQLDDPAIKAGVRKKLTDFKDIAYLSRDLARICKEVPITLSFDAQSHRETLFDLLAELEFSSFIKRLGVTKETTHIENTAPSAQNIKGEKEHADEACTPAYLSDEPYKEAAAEEVLALTGGMAAVLEPDALLVCTEEDLRLRVPSPEKETLKAFFESKERQIAVYDCKSVYAQLYTLGIEEFEAWDDPMLGAYVRSSIEGDYSFGALMLRYLSTTEKAPAPHLILALCQRINGELKNKGEETLYKEIELPLGKVLAGCERAGFLLDKEGISAFSRYLEGCISSLEEQVYQLAGEKFNINSPKQLSSVLFEKLSLPVIKKTKSGYSTDAEVLEKLRPYHPIINAILEYRQLAKLHSTYTVGLLKVAGEDGRVHTCFTQTVTATGRLSSIEPNLQNIPVRTELGRELRRFFITDEGKVLIDADYSQIELRLLAHVSEDEAMIEAFHSGVDIHTVTASQVFGVPVEHVTSEERKKAKAVNFGIVYGISAFSLADDIKVSRKEADEYIKGYFATYPGIKSYLERTVALAKEQGFVTTMFGRKRAIPELTSGKGMLKKFGERVAMNSPIQGSAADIIKIAMVRVDRALKSEGLNARLILQVHDELIVEADRADAPRAAEILKREMENAAVLRVPLTVELNIGESWYECK